MKSNIFLGKGTWCPGCFNFHIMTGFKNYLEKEISKGARRSQFAMVTGIGCHAKMFDYINLNGINTLHGRVLPTCLGMKIGNPNLKIFGFSGDGDAYAEGMAHTIHAARYNADMVYVVHNNQVFALTTGQSTPTTEKNFADKTNPAGVKFQPMNPIKLMLSAGASFVARIFANAKEVEDILREAANHKGFAFVEILQPCIVFHPDAGYKEKTYSLKKAGHDKTSLKEAMKKAEEFDYNTINKIPVGIFYQEKRPSFVENFPKLLDLQKRKKSWKDIKR